MAIGFQGGMGVQPQEAVGFLQFEGLKTANNYANNMKNAKNIMPMYISPRFLKLTFSKRAMVPRGAPPTQNHLCKLVYNYKIWNNMIPKDNKIIICTK